MHETSITCRDRSFVLVHSDPDDHIFRLVRNSGAFYEQALLERLSRFLSPGDLVLDIGANIGNHSLYFAGICGAQVIAFEPNPTANRLLAEAVRRNDLAGRITVRTEAVGARDGVGRIIEPQAHNLGMAGVETGEGEITVLALDGIDFDPPPRLIKIDVEGMEGEVLAGARALLEACRPVVVLESDRPEHLAAILSVLEPLGYGVLEAHNFTPTFVLTADAAGQTSTALGQVIARQAFSIHAVEKNFTAVRTTLYREFAELRKRVEGLATAAEPDSDGASGMIARLTEAFEAQTATLDTVLAQSIAALRDGLHTDVDALTGRIDAVGEEIRRNLSDQIRASGAALRDRLPDPDHDPTAADRAMQMVLQDGLWQADRRPAPPAPVEIPYYCVRFAEGWQGWRYHQACRLGDAGRLTINQDKSTPGLRSPAIPVVGPGLQSVRVILAAQPADGWVLRVTEAGTGDLLQADAPLTSADTTVRLYMPRRVSKVDLKIITLKPRIGLTAQVVELRLSKLDDAGVYRMRGTGTPPVIASMASIPSRREMLFDAVHSLLPQCDEVRVFLNGYGEVPDFLDHPRVRVRRSEDYDDMGDAGKFGWLDDDDPPGYRLIVDDDLLFPPDLVDRLVARVRQTGDTAMVGLHGILIRQPVVNYYKPENRRAIHFQSRVETVMAVHVLATCVMCAHSDRLTLSRSDFMFRNMADVWLAKHARDNDIPLLLIDRPFKWVRENTQSEAYETIYQNSLTGSGSGFDSSAIQDAVLRTAGPLTLISPDLPMAAVVAGVGSVADLHGFVQGFEATRDPAWVYKLILLAVDPAPELRAALGSVPLATEVHVVASDTLAGGEAALNRLLAALTFDAGLYCDARWRCRNGTWAQSALRRFRDSDQSLIRLVSGPDARPTIGVHGLALDPAPGGSALQLALFKPGTTLTLQVTSPPRKRWREAPVGALPATDVNGEALSIARGLAEAVDPRGQAPSLSTEGQGRPAAVAATGETPPRIATFFDRVVVLNLDRRPDRWRRISDQLARLGVSARRHRAVDARWPEVSAEFRRYAGSALRRVSPEMPPLRTSRDFYLNPVSEAQRVAYLERTTGMKAINRPGAWGYLASLAQILEQAIRDDVTHLLMLDDDAVFHREADAIFGRAVAELPADWKILQLGSLQYHWDADWITWRSPHLYSQKGSCIGSHALGLHRDIFPFLLERARRREIAFDVGALSEASRAYPDRNFVIVPNIAIQSVTESDIRSSGFQQEADIDEVFATYRWTRADYGA